MAATGILSEEERRVRNERLERSMAETRRFCEEQHELAIATTRRSQKLGGWLDVIQMVTVASLGASTAALLIALLSSAAACH